MPQASDEDRERYRRQFGDILCQHGIKRLEEKGYTLTEDWLWIPPVNHEPTEYELFIIGFLIDEWDFGGILK